MEYRPSKRLRSSENYWVGSVGEAGSESLQVCRAGDGDTAHIVPNISIDGVKHSCILHAMDIYLFCCFFFSTSCPMPKEIFDMEDDKVPRFGVTSNIQNRYQGLSFHIKLEDKTLNVEDDKDPF